MPLEDDELIARLEATRMALTAIVGVMALSPGTAEMAKTARQLTRNGMAERALTTGDSVELAAKLSNLIENIFQAVPD